MRIRSRFALAAIITGLVFLVFFAGLCIPAIMAGRSNLRNLLLIQPEGRAASRGINTAAIEDFTADEFLISYSINSSQRFVLPHAEFPVTVTATTSAYAQMLGLPLVNGSFFGAQAWKGKLRHAVLNETAAVNIFGNTAVSGSRFRMLNESWIVTGVINDGDEDRGRVYIPSSVQGADAVSLIALMDKSIDEAYIKSRLKTLGILEGDYTFYNFRTIIGLLRDRIIVLVLFLAGLLLLSILASLWKKIIASFNEFLLQKEHRYIREIAKAKPGFIIKPSVYALLFLSAIAAALFLFLRAVSIMLPWQNILFLNSLNWDLFYPYIENLRNLEFASRILFILDTATLAVFIAVLNIYLFGRKTKKTG